MLASPWKSFRIPDPGGNFIALLSYLPLKTFRRIPSLLIYNAKIMKQLANARGLLGYSVLAQPLSRKFWTLSAWENEQALQTFVHHLPHQQIMAALAAHMDEPKFLRWTVTGSQLPLQWDDALRRFAANTSGESK